MIKKQLLLLLVCTGVLWSTAHCTNPSGESDTGGDADGDTDGDADGDTDGDADGDTDGDADGDTDGDSDGDADGDTDGDSDGDTDGDTDGDADGDSDEEIDWEDFEPQPGGKFPNLIGVDAHTGDTFELKKEIGSKPFLIDFSIKGCIPCEALAGYLSGDEEVQFIENWREWANNINTKLENDDLGMVTVVWENPTDPTLLYAETWVELYPHNRIVVLDGGPSIGVCGQNIAPVGFPTFYYIDTDQTIHTMEDPNDPDSAYAALKEANKL